MYYDELSYNILETRVIQDVLVMYNGFRTLDSENIRCCFFLAVVLNR